MNFPHSESRNQGSRLERSFKKFRVRNLQKILFPSNFVYFSLFSNRFQQIWKKEDWASDQIELHEAMKSQSCHFSVLVWWKVQSGLSRFYRLLPLWTNFRSWQIWEQTKSHLCSVSKHWFHLHPPPHPHLHPETTDHKVSSEYLSIAPEEVFPMHKKPQPLPIQRSGLPPCLQRPAPCKGRVTLSSKPGICHNHYNRWL